jgi:hypothetical protein
MTGMGGKRSFDNELPAIADLIDRFLIGDVGPYEWDDFCSLRGRTPQSEALRTEIAGIGDDFSHPTHWCSEEGIARLRDIAKRLRSEAAP